MNAPPEPPPVIEAPPVAPKSGFQRAWGTMVTQKRTTPGVAYVGLCGFLLSGMAATLRTPDALRAGLHRRTSVQ